MKAAAGLEVPGAPAGQPRGFGVWTLESGSSLLVMAAGVTSPGLSLLLCKMERTQECSGDTAHPSFGVCLLCRTWSSYCDSITFVDEDDEF